MTKNKTELETLQHVPNFSENIYDWLILMKVCIARDLDFNK